MSHKKKHGSASEYNNYKCRCAKCTTAWAAYMKNLKAGKVRSDKGADLGIKHGTQSGYHWFKCSCALCRKYHSGYTVQQRNKHD